MLSKEENELLTRSRSGDADGDAPAPVLDAAAALLGAA